MSYKCEPNLSNHLVCASHFQPPMLSDAGSYCCKRRHCNTCKFVTTHIKGLKGYFNVTETFTCISTNIVYDIICRRCNIVYVGETGYQLVDRINEHMCSIKNNVSGFPVAHVNPPHTAHYSVTGIIHCSCSNVNRLNVENRIIS